LAKLFIISSPKTDFSVIRYLKETLSLDTHEQAKGTLSRRIKLTFPDPATEFDAYKKREDVEESNNPHSALLRLNLSNFGDAVK
jgi:hypothetical protein